MKFAYIVPTCALLVASAIAYQAVASIEPILGQDLIRIRGGQIACLQLGFQQCSGSNSSTCDSVPCGANGCPAFDAAQRSTRTLPYPTCVPGSPGFTAACTSKGLFCSYSTSCNGDCKTKKTSKNRSQLYCSTFGPPTPFNAVVQQIPQWSPCGTTVITTTGSGTN